MRGRDSRTLFPLFVWLQHLHVLPDPLHRETPRGNPRSLIDPNAAGESWHANLLRIEGRKCVLFTHDATLYSVFVPGCRKPDFAELDQVFGQRLFKALLWEALPQDVPAGTH